MKPTKPNYVDLLNQAISEPGKLLEAYSAFRQYSQQNQLFALMQLSARDIKIGPIATYKQWEKKGRQVKKGEKAISLLCPVPCAIKEEKNGEEKLKAFTFFKVKNYWFSVHQTEGQELAPVENIPWDKKQALETLGIQLVDFEMTNGNVQGYATHDKKIAINPLAQLPEKTMFHELAHIVLGHTDVSFHDTGAISKDIKELEAEATAMLCLASLGLPGIEYCRGYIQNWYKGETIPEKSAKAIIQAANTILKAGEAKASSATESSDAS